MTSPCRHGRLDDATHGAAAAENTAPPPVFSDNDPANTRRPRFQAHGCGRPHRSFSNQPFLCPFIVSFDRFTAKHANITPPPSSSLASRGTTEEEVRHLRELRGSTVWSYYGCGFAAR